jgi:ubiquinone/menaquinone biosynthesis C-methylase UbiE
MTQIVSCGSDIPVDRSIRSRQQAIWASGDFSVIGATLQIVGELLTEAADVRSGHDVLDVAAGSGNATLAAARRFARVTSCDYVPAFLERGRQRAEAEGFGGVAFDVADAEALPYRDASFDIVLSTFGVMFASDHERAAHEIWRVCRKGGRIALANWTPSGFVGQLFRLVGKHVPPLPGAQAPALWGTDAHLRSLFPNAARIDVMIRTFAFRYRSAEHWVEVFRDHYGPIHSAFARLAPNGRAALEADLISLLRSFDTGGPDGLVVPAEYAEIVIAN